MMLLKFWGLLFMLVGVGMFRTTVKFANIGYTTAVKIVTMPPVHKVWNQNLRGKGTIVKLKSRSRLGVGQVRVTHLYNIFALKGV